MTESMKNLTSLYLSSNVYLAIINCNEMFRAEIKIYFVNLRLVRLICILINEGILIA